ncbi:hypothetical protein N7517_001454 [Penicillium concentricum]|uniref:Uncharacterized protein n=1 Tax=Penicillium concentricum TaxID=293559 RepID=A0A9W9VIJ2_9EURO|nr:uncharacterized protein N7517_001454 [Penicillium concentricum]KAJ5383543.1 hypothetical protein N7517_001454 [Penicillium concentricum]
MTHEARCRIFLTNRLTKEQTQRLQEIRVEPDEFDALRYDEWKNGEAGMTDGKVKDIWEIINAYLIWCESDDPLIFVFIDAQFAPDQTVILVRADVCNDCDPEHELLRHMPFFALKGLPVYAHPHTAHMFAWKKNEMIDGEWSSYRRPGWLSPSLLPDG